MLNFFSENKNELYMFFAKYNGVVNYVYAEEIRARLMNAILKFDIER